MDGSHRLAADLEFVKQLAAEAAQIALARAAGVTPQEKANLSYVTDLDQDLERLIRERLGNRFPDDRLTGEEYSAAGGKGPRLWSIDPIDGTGNLVHQLPLWAVSIGLIEAGEPVLGVIVIPPLHETYWAVKGGGAWRDGTRCGRSIPTRSTARTTSASARTRCGPSTRSLPGRLRDLGSACCEQTFVAANRLRACTFLGEALHDVAAGTVIAAEAGCEFGTVKGAFLTPAEMVARTPVTVPTFVAPPRRLRALMAAAKLL